MIPGVYSAFIGLSTGFISSLIGWQLNLVVMHRGLERGRAAAFYVGVGAAAADVLFLLVALTGLTPFAHHPELWIHLKWISIAMLLTVASRIYFRKKKSFGSEPKEKRRDPAKNFLFGIVMVGSNPLLFVLWVGIVSFLVSHFPEAEILSHRVAFILSFVVGAIAWWGILSGIILRHARKWDDEKLHTLSRVFSIALVIGAFALMWAKF